MSTNRAIRLASRPVGLPTDDDWELGEEPVGEPGEGEVVVEVRTCRSTRRCAAG